MKYYFLLPFCLFLSAVNYAQNNPVKKLSRRVRNNFKISAVKLDTIKMKGINKDYKIDTLNNILDTFDLNGNQITIQKLKNRSSTKDSLNKVNPIIKN